jgi:hypothetical protein
MLRMVTPHMRWLLTVHETSFGYVCHRYDVRLPLNSRICPSSLALI